MWREQAKVLFFIKHMSINEIAAAVNKARETVSRFITRCEGYEAEISYRKEQSAAHRREYKRDWDKLYRSGAFDITKESLRREHITAVKILSSERY